MRDLWSNLAEIRGRVAPQTRLLFLMDFDGTLSPLAEAPENAHLPEDVRQTLSRLADRPCAQVAILSGRPLDYLTTVFHAPSFFYGGNHGLEMEGPDFSFQHPGACALRGVVQELAGKFREQLATVPGALLENKGLSLALHYRNVPSARHRELEALIEAFKKETAGLPVQWRHGIKVWELLPLVDWDKGCATTALLKRLEFPFPIAMGDDRTDADMFDALSGNGITVQVGNDCDLHAQFSLPIQSDVPRFLAFLEETLR
jgi:trehalose-phosphatase